MRWLAAILVTLSLTACQSPRPGPTVKIIVAGGHGSGVGLTGIGAIVPGRVVCDLLARS